MRVELAYGDGHSGVILPAGLAADYVTPRDITGFEDPAEAVVRAFSQPVEAPPLADVMRGIEGGVLLVVSDLTRSGGTKEILPLVIQYLESVGVARAEVQILVARGTHRKLTKEEKRYFKSDALKGVRMEEHDCDDAASMSALLLTKRGTPVRVNRRLKEAGLVVLVSPISFHYFAGFGGGRKLVLPGSADRAAILANHRLSLVDEEPVTLHPACRPGNLDGNPVSDDMEEALAALSNVYALNLFGDTSGRIVYVNAGDAVQSHLQACEDYRAAFRVPVERAYDVAIVSSGGHPYDINLVQAHKALKHAADAVNPGGTILFYARCREGVGSESLSRAIHAPREKFFKSAYRDYDLNNQTGISLLTLSKRYRLSMMTDLDEDTLAAAGIARCANPEACLAEALEIHNAGRVALIPYGSQTLPFEKRGDAA
jgi:nickel-dependent lactate racemase